MAWSWDDYTNELSRVLDDEGADPSYSDALRLDGLITALRALVAYVPYEKKATATGVNVVAVPTDCYSVLSVTGVIDELTVLTANAIGNPGDIPGDTDTYYIWAGNIYLDKEYDTVSVYYKGYYPDVTPNTTSIPVPTWARDAIVYRAAAHCLMPSLASRARLGAFHDRADAQPLQNSLIQAADWFLTQYDRIMNEHKRARS